jgi:outer membrane receptor for ferrienterochelin and colicins
MYLKTKPILFVCSVSLSFCPFLTLSAEEEEELDDIWQLSLEDLFNIEVETATKTAEKSSLSPAIMTVVTAQDIAIYGYESVAEVVNHVAGFVDNFDLATHNIGVRGINSGVRSGSRTIKFMIDGQAIAFRATSQNFIGKELIAMDLVERVEIVRGPVSALYGANAFLGVVNIVTKKGSKLKDSGGEVSLKYNDISDAGQGYQLDYTYGDNTGLWDYRVGMSIGKEDRDGIDLPRRSPGFNSYPNPQSTSDEAAPLNFYARGVYQLDPDSNVKLSVFYQALESDNPFADINALQTTGVSKIGLSNLSARTDYEVNLTDKVNLHAFAAYTKGDTLDSDKVEVGAQSFYLDRRFGFDGFDFGAEIFINFREADNLLIGFDSKRDKQMLESFTRVDRASGDRTVLNPDQDKVFTDIGLYLQYIVKISENWKGVLGYRMDDDSVIGQQSSARLGIVGELPYGIVLKVLSGGSFQAPSPELLFREAVQSGDVIGNPELDAQKASTIEVSLAAPISDFMHLTATYFNTTVDDLVVFESDSSNLFAKNSTGSETDGIELEARFLWQNFNAYVNYTRQDTTRERNPLSLYALEYRPNGELFPEQMANFGVTYSWSSIRFSWQTQWIGERPASTQNVLVANQFYELDSYTDSTFSISTNSFSLFEDKEATLRFQIRDVFDNHHVDPGFGGIDFPSLGRQLSLSFEQRF